MLFVPQLDQPAGRVGLDRADLVQVIGIAEGQPASVDLIGAREEVSPQVESGPEIDVQTEIGDPLVNRPLAQAAG